MKRKYLNPISLSRIAIVLIFFISACQKDFTLDSVASGNQDTSVTESANKPNILFIVGDDIGYEIPTINRGQSYSTPNIDKLARDGMSFTQCRSAPECSPSRFMLLTGKYNFRNYTVWGQMNHNQRTIGNMLKDAGYATCYAGKWQLDGGNQSIHTFGFDHYSVWLPFRVCPEDAEGSRYKSAKIYRDGGYLPQNMTNGKYSEDEFTQYVMDFMESNKSKPFFAYYDMILSHKAFSPTPDDPEYAGWNPNPANSDSKYFPSMVKYMDKKIGMLINKLESLGIANNTVIIYIGDNGTQKEITSVFNGKRITGGKGKTKEYGIHVPLICKWPGRIRTGAINNDLIDFTDFLPTLAGISNIPVPGNYGILDGTSFYPRLTGGAGNPRSSVFCHFRPNNCSENDKLFRYAQDNIYKLYETGEFYDFTKDPNERKPLVTSLLTPKQKQTRQKLQNVINAMHN